MTSSENGQPFRPRARLLQLLGDQLIGSSRLALFELIKNAYDADATEVTVDMEGLGSPDARIVVRDNGTGMTRKVVESIWLVPGHDHKGKARESGDLTDRKRFPLGEKGLGRFAVHKLGNVISLVTRSKGSSEVFLELDWDDLTKVEFLEDTRVQIGERKPKVFKDDETGTQITVSSLRGEEWTRGEVRRLARQITSISSPFAKRSDQFSVTLSVPGHKDWLEKVPTVTDLLSRAPWRFDFKIEQNEFSWTYEFFGVPGTGVSQRKVTGTRRGVLLDTTYLSSTFRERLEDPEGTVPKEVVSTSSYQDGIGPISGVLYGFDRDRDVLDKMANPRAVEDFLDDNGGVRIYRDSMRVYNYGEPTDDWLGLDLRRVNVPSRRLSRNLVVGAIDLVLSESGGLEEKTNREGFVENAAFDRLQALVLGVIAAFESERYVDKQILRNIGRKARDIDTKSITTPLRKLAKIAKQNGLSEQVDPLIETAQRAYDDMRDVMLRTGVSGLTLAVVFHEIDHGVHLLQRSLEDGVPVERVVAQTKDLLSLLDGFGELLRRGDVHVYDLKFVLERAVALNRVRLRNHSIELRIDDDVDRDVLAELPLGLVLGAFTNLVDNSVYWLRTKWPDEIAQGRRRMYLRIDDRSFAGGPAVVIADNGPGVVDDLADITRPFYSRRPDGIGIGLYYVNMIMTLSGGSLLMPTREEANVPEEFDGAIFALVFKRA